MPQQPLNVLFLCNTNSARSIFAESLINHWGNEHLRGFSGGSNPKGEVNAVALDLLQQLNLPTEGLRSKDWYEFAAEEAPEMDFVFTLCDETAEEVCPVWPGQPVTARWSVPDPAKVKGDDLKVRNAFRRAFSELENRIKIFASLPFDSLEEASLQHEVDQIGQTTVDAE